jgi:6-phosphofructokinase
LITITEDDTAYSTARRSKESVGHIWIVHVPKTINNDLDFPPCIDTFRFKTSRLHGVDIVKNCMTDAETI